MLGDWPVNFPGCEPVAHLLKTAFPSRWVRFHNLPESKRYPDDEEEFAIVLGRQNRVLDELVGSEASVILLSTEYSGSPDPVEVTPYVPELRAFDRDAKPWHAVAMHELDENFQSPCYWHIFASEWAWRPCTFDPLLRLVANDQIANIMILHPGCKWLFHPYDGGMDLILESSAARDHIRSSHLDWLSPWPSGL